MRSRRKSHDEDLNLVGQDSFLDVVANLVGILVILITVIGVGARGAHVTAAANDLDTTNPLDTVVAERQARAENLEQDLNRLQVDLAELDLSVQQRRLERDGMLARLEIVRQAIADERNGLDAKEKEMLRWLQEAESLRDQLRDLENQEKSLDQDDPTPTTLTHDTTPLAETVYGSEQHFRLIGGRLDYVPLNELVARLKEDAERNAWKMKETTELTETLGPVEGYYMQYTLALQEEPVMTPQGPALQRMVALDQFILIPVDSKIGFPLVDQLQDGSDLANRLRGIDPATTITVWTYPDSYGAFRELRDWLAKRGFRAAARPLPAGQPIAGSPRGSRSAAQ